MTRCGISIVLVGCTVLLVVGEVGAAGDGHAPRGYVKKDTWVQTMLAARATLAAMSGQRAEATSAKPFLSEPIAGDGPGQAISVSVSGVQTMRLVSVMVEGKGNCHIWGDARLIAKDGSQTRLSSLTPTYVSVGWGDLLKDENWLHKPLAIGQRTFEHGIWVHANSDVCYRLDKKYERLEAWIGMDAHRAAGQARFQVLFDTPDLAPQLAARISRDFPEPSKWLAEDSGRKRELDWFRDATAQTDQVLIGRALGACGPAAALRRELSELQRAKAPYDDPRWLDLYTRACRYRQVYAVAQRIWIVEIRQAVLERLEALVWTAAEAPAWAALRAKAERLTGPDQPGVEVHVAALRPAMEQLAQHLAGQYQAAPALLARADEARTRLQAFVSGLTQGQDAAVADLAALSDQIAGLRRALFAAMPGVGEFLSTPGGAQMDREWLQQYRALAVDLGRREHFRQVAGETFRPASLILDADRDPLDVVLRRTAALLADLSAKAPRTADAGSSLAGCAAELERLRQASAAIGPEHPEARLALFAGACRLRRQIALRNPLLDFSEILFIKRHRALFNHMCDQYYGMAAMPGGGLYVLRDPFGPDPQVRDLLADAVVTRGRLTGQKLSGGPLRLWDVRFDGNGNLHGEETTGGCFLSPDLSYDGRTVAFAYVECQGDREHRHHTDATRGHWHEGRCYHVFKVDIDGTHLEQLTDGTWNEFDPCWLPNGRIAMISERRGGYLRCGRVCPNYNLFDMAADGSDIQCLSFHETNEWHPSVTHDGRILYTRWDYVDRFGCTAHHPWITTLDGRDSRAVHGNFAPRAARPDMELDCRAIPNSPKFLATAAPHHGQAFGSLVTIDPRIEDDDAMGPVKRITPEVGFPECQGGGQVYGTAWPLSEDYYLCVYDGSMDPSAGRQGGGFLRGDYGIYLVDSFGNRELLYRDPQIACQNPIPVRPRPIPPRMPEMHVRRAEANPAVRAGLPAAAQAPEGTAAVINVYESIKPWPEATQIKSLRVLQVLPMTVPSGSLRPHETGLREPSARDSVVPVRYVLGTVPVEDDGSAHFIVPANKEMFFQALDDRGLAVQSMRSATYVHEGERLLCQGCHEPKHRAPQLPSVLPKALRREPSRLVADVDGSNPFSYPRLVQPVLDKHCVDCHAKESKTAPNLAREPIQRNWFASYNNLAEKYGFWDYGDGLRTTPGRFGARASKLYELLQKGHYDVKLSDEELHRLTLWLDCVSMFYGVYEKEGGEAQLRGEIARPTLE